MGESSPLPGYSGDDLDAVHRELLWFAETLGACPGSPAEIERLVAASGMSPAARFAAETALLDLLARSQARPIHWLLRDFPGLPVARSGLLLEPDQGEIAREARGKAASGLTSLKVKIGALPIDAEVARLQAVAAALPPGVLLRLDANGAYSPPQWSELASKIQHLPVELIEEPVAPEAMASLGQGPIPWAADESLAAQAQAMLDNPSCAALVLKPAQLGLFGALRLADRARRASKQILVTHLFDGPVALAAACELALALAGPALLPCGLDPHPGLDAYPRWSIPHLRCPGLVVPSDRDGLGLGEIALLRPGPGPVGRPYCGRLAQNEETHRGTSGALFAVAAYGSWGLVPIYWKALGPVPAIEVLAHRVVWSLACVSLVIGAVGQWGEVRAALGSRRTAARLLLTTALISANWGLFIWAVQSGRLLQASLGYYINPLLNVLLGVLVLGERLRRGQAAAVALAAAGVLVMTFAAGVLPWVSLLLAGSFGLYGLLRKTAQVDALTGLFIETALVAPVALGYIARCELSGQGALGQGTLAHGVLLSICGPVTALPLLWFTAAARRLPLSTLGFFQYIAPTLQFILASRVYGEPVSPAHMATFALIWAGLLVFSIDARRAARRG